MNITSFNESLIFDDYKISTKVIIETSFSKEIRILLKQGQMMKEHQAPYPILIHILEGEISIGINGTKEVLSKGNIVALDAQIPHDLTAIDDSIIRLTLSKYDSVERVEKDVH